MWTHWLVIYGSCIYFYTCLYKLSSQIPIRSSKISTKWKRITSDEKMIQMQAAQAIPSIMKWSQHKLVANMTCCQIGLQIRFNYSILIHIRTAITVATRHVSWAQNIPKMRLRPGCAPDPDGVAYMLTSSHCGTLRGVEG